MTNRNIFGWSYPPGAANDPRAPWNQVEEDCPKCEGLGNLDGDICTFCDGTGERDDELLGEQSDELNRDDNDN